MTGQISNQYPDLPSWMTVVLHTDDSKEKPVAFDHEIEISLFDNILIEESLR